MAGLITTCVVRAKARIEFPRQRKKGPSVLPFAVHTLCSVEKRGTYQQKLDQYLDLVAHSTGSLPGQALAVADQPRSPSLFT